MRSWRELRMIWGRGRGEMWGICGRNDDIIVRDVESVTNGRNLGNSKNCEIGENEEEKKDDNNNYQIISKELSKDLEEHDENNNLQLTGTPWISGEAEPPTKESVGHLLEEPPTVSLYSTNEPHIKQQNEEWNEEDHGIEADHPLPEDQTSSTIIGNRVIEPKKKSGNAVQYVTQFLENSNFVVELESYDRKIKEIENALPKLELIFRDFVNQRTRDIENETKMIDYQLTIRNEEYILQKGKEDDLSRKVNEIKTEIAQRRLSLRSTYVALDQLCEGVGLEVAQYQELQYLRRNLYLFLKEYQYIALNQEIEMCWNIDLLRALGMKIRELDYQPSKNSQRLPEAFLDERCLALIQELDSRWRVLLIKIQSKYLSENCRKTLLEFQSLYDEWNLKRKDKRYAKILDGSEDGEGERDDSEGEGDEGGSEMRKKDKISWM